MGREGASSHLLASSLSQIWSILYLVPLVVLGVHYQPISFHQIHIFHAGTLTPSNSKLSLIWNLRWDLVWGWMRRALDQGIFGCYGWRSWCKTQQYRNRYLLHQNCWLLWSKDTKLAQSDLDTGVCCSIFAFRLIETASSPSSGQKVDWILSPKDQSGGFCSEMLTWSRLTKGDWAGWLPRSNHRSLTEILCVHTFQHSFSQVTRIFLPEFLWRRLCVEVSSLTGLHLV